MKSKLISIIVPVYNGEPYIDRCVRSVLLQEYQEWELVLVDGASVDGTLQLCRAWQKRDDRIRVIHTDENRGVSAGRNAGMEKARGAYLFFLDADDWLLPDCLARLYAQIQEADVDIAGCAFERCTGKDWEVLYEDIRINGIGTARQENCSRRLIEGREFLKEGILQQDTRCWSKLYRRQLVEGHFFSEDYTIGEDMLFLWEVSAEARKISSSDYKGYCYYHNPSGAMQKPFRESDMDQIRCWQTVLKSLQSSGRNEQTARCAAILLISCMLVAGKLAELPGEQRKHYRPLRRKCSQVLEETLKIPGAYEGLDRSYRLKVRLYRSAPEFYLFLYPMFRRRSRDRQYG